MPLDFGPQGRLRALAEQLQTEMLSAIPSDGFLVNSREVRRWIKQLDELFAALDADADARQEPWEQRARELLWKGHGCPVHLLYGDDGEMQCSNSARHRSWDFKRTPWDELTQQVFMLRVTESQADADADARQQHANVSGPVRNASEQGKARQAGETAPIEIDSIWKDKGDRLVRIVTVQPTGIGYRNTETGRLAYSLPARFLVAFEPVADADALARRPAETGEPPRR